MQKVGDRGGKRTGETGGANNSGGYTRNNNSGLDKIPPIQQHVDVLHDAAETPTRMGTPYAELHLGGLSFEL